MLNTLLIVVPATVAFAGLFFTLCEKPYMRKGVKKVGSVEEQHWEEQRAEEPVLVFAQTLPAVADEV